MLECGGVVRADGEELDGELHPSEYVSSDWKSQKYFSAGGETNQVREHLLPSLAAKAAGDEGRCSQFTLTRPPFSSSVGHG